MMYAAAGNLEGAEKVFEQFAALLIPYLGSLKAEEKEALKKELEEMSNQVVVLSPALLSGLKEHALKEKKDDLGLESRDPA